MQITRTSKIAYLDDKLIRRFCLTQLVHLFDFSACVSSPIKLPYFHIYSRLKMVQFISFPVIVLGVFPALIFEYIITYATVT